MEPLRLRANAAAKPTRPYRDEDEYWPARPPSSAVRYAATQGDPYSQRVDPRQLKRRRRPPSVKVIFILCAVILFVGYVVWTLILLPFFTNISNQWHYGDARVSVMSADVGRGQEEFVSFTQNNRIVIIEIGRTYQAYMANIDVSGSHVVTLTVKDVNADGKPDLVVSIDGDPGNFVLFNTGKGFSWSQ